MTTAPVTQHVSTLLPPDARMLLVSAASIHNSEERHRAIDEVTKRIKLRYPKFFKITEVPVGQPA